MRVKVREIIQMHACCWEDTQRTAEVLGIHRSTVYRWIKRARTISRYIKYKQLKRKSTRPHTIQTVLTTQEEDRIIRLHIQTGFTAIKLKKELGVSCSVSTINRFLKKKGYMREYGYHRRPYVVKH